MWVQLTPSVAEPFSPHSNPLAESSLLHQHAVRGGGRWEGGDGRMEGGGGGWMEGG